MSLYIGAIKIEVNVVKINYMEYPYPLNIFVEASDKMGMPLAD